MAGIYFVMGVVTFLAIGWDKRKAARGSWRMPEQRLHILELAGGVIGSLIGQRVFRHKNRKWRFFIVTWAIALLHAAGWIGWTILQMSGCDSA